MRSVVCVYAAATVEGTVVYVYSLRVSCMCQYALITGCLYKSPYYSLYYECICLNLVHCIRSCTIISALYYTIQCEVSAMLAD